MPVTEPLSDTDRTTGTGAVARPALFQFRDLSEDDPETFARAWLDVIGSRLGGVRQGVLLLPMQGNTLEIASALPAGDEPSRPLRACVEATLSRGRAVTREEGGDLYIGCPYRADDQVIAIAAFVLPTGGDVEQLLDELRWGAGWVRGWHADRQRDDAAPGLERARGAFELLGAALDQGTFIGSARKVATQLARLADCDRVSIGFRRRGHSRIAAISHSAQFGRSMTLSRLLAGAMDEAIDQQATILHPAPQGAPPYGDRAQSQLARESRAGFVLTVPVLGHDRFIGAFVFERPQSLPFDQATIDFLVSLAAFAGPVLEERRRNDRWLITKIGESIGSALLRLVGPGYLKTKLAIVAIAALAAFGWYATGTYRIAGDARLEGSIQRALTAPFDGFVADATYTAGDRVAEGSVIARLDDRDLTLERLNWVAERQRFLLEYEQALGLRDRARLAIARAQIDQAEAQVELLDERLRRARIRAPFPGVLVSGDLSQSIGAAVTRGQTLFELAPLDSYRIVVWVGDDQIDEIHVGQSGSLVLAALPSVSLPVTIAHITPVAEVREGRNAFKVMASIAGPVGAHAKLLRPGMEGVAKLDVDQRRLVWIWTRSFVDWWRLTVWRWMG